MCPVCLRTGATPGSTAASEAARLQHSSGTQTAAPVRLAPGEHPYPRQFQTTQSDANRTATPLPDGGTPGFNADAIERLPEPPPGYDLIRRLGSGGMGTVYLAHEHATERCVAIKFLHSPTSGTAFDRFLVEVRALAELKHDNIINVLDVKTTWREPYFTMDFASGGTLADLTKSGRLVEPLDAARLMKAAAEAVAAAHAKNILHRDMKPSNILLFGDRASPATLVPKVSDFGLAKRTDRDDELTRTGPLGTPCFMSPEAASGKFRELTTATDVYGLGATLFHLLAGRPPFIGEANDEIIRKVIDDPPARLRSLRPELPAALEAIAMKAMEKNPAARYPTATAFAEDLGRFLAGDVPLARELSPRRRAQRWFARRRNRIALGFGVVLVAAGLVAVGYKLSTNPDPQPVPSAAEIHLASVKRELAAGLPATLLGPKGNPVYYRWQLGAGEFGKSTSGDDACTYATNGLGLLELMDNPGIDRYRIHLEIRQGDTPDGEGKCGLYFGHSFAPGAEGVAADAFFAVAFRDHDPSVALNQGQIEKQLVRFDKMILGHRPTFNVDRIPVEVAALKFDPAIVRPSVWRTIEVEVEPGSIHAYWKALEGGAREEFKHGKGKPLDPEQMYQAMQTTLREDIRYSNKAIVLPRWSPRMAIGVYTAGCNVSIKNFTITPLSPAL